MRISSFCLSVLACTSASIPVALQAQDAIPRPGAFFKLQTAFGEGDQRCLEGNRLAKESVLGGAAFQDACRNVTGQAWTIKDAGNGYVTLQTRQHGAARCLEGNRLDERSVLKGGAFMDACKNVSGQKWKIVNEGDYFRLKTAQHGEARCLEGNSRGEGSVLKGAAFMDTCQNVSGQMWKIVPIA